jgi:hypothetical protein
MTLAYVFWHWKQASVDRAEYERGQATAPSAALEDGRARLAEGADALGLEADVLGHGLDLERAPLDPDRRWRR